MKDWSALQKAAPIESQDSVDSLVACLVSYTAADWREFIAWSPDHSQERLEDICDDMDEARRMNPILDAIADLPLDHGVVAPAERMETSAIEPAWDEADDILADDRLADMKKLALGERDGEK